MDEPIELEQPEVITPIKLLDKMIESGEDIWEAAKSLASSSEVEMTERRWLLGDVASRIEKQYGKNRIGDFAKDTGNTVSSLKQYRAMAKFYEKSTRYLFENLTWSHYRHAKRLKDLETSLDLLEQASVNSWSCEMTGVEIAKKVGKKVPPKKLLDAECSAKVIDPRTGDVTFHVTGIDADTFINLQKKTVRLKVYELPEAA
jgi:hypothetical protein